ncbi:c-type cytochrome [Sulfuricurvum sp.]|uniref:c-type cytochrome n=1 Tax=Sulfuricurvum sp. TaxID=2025608 RepID=UPI002D25F5CB|nr:c-type cytochrome [Sulfuricurvum sp.]HZF69320.1 c-type cytochrome [Sulfuricurvum sp.]
MTKTIALLILGVSVVMAANNAKIYGAKCGECHGMDGKDTSIAGKAIAGGTGALAKLTGYKNGTYGGAQKEIMQGNVTSLSDEELKAVAEYVDTLK